MSAGAAYFVASYGENAGRIPWGVGAGWTVLAPAPRCGPSAAIDTL